MTTKVFTPNLDSFADAIDRLCVELLKLSAFETAKREEHAKENPDPVLVAKWDNLSRDCCEYRSMLKNHINQTLKTIIENKEYKCLKELRTFRPPSRSVEDVIADMVENTINNQNKIELIQKLSIELSKIEDKS